MGLSISYVFRMKEFLIDYLNVVKSFNSALLFIYVYVMNDTKGLVQVLREIKYVVARSKNTLTYRVCMQVVTMNIPMNSLMRSARFCMTWG